MERFDIVVVGAGHAGCEASLAAARIGARVLLVTGNLDTVAQMSCNPAIGGIGKGHIVREIDALGGAMGLAIDKTGIQFRMLNRSKGPAMQGPRAQADKKEYQNEIKRILENQPNLQLRQDRIVSIVTESIDVSTFSSDSISSTVSSASNASSNRRRVVGVQTDDGVVIYADAVVLCCGTFLRGVLHFGERMFSGGRASEPSSEGVSESLLSLGIDVSRFKTGTPPRINSRSINYSLLSEHYGDIDPTPFSFLSDRVKSSSDQVSCWIAYTNVRLHEYIRDNLRYAPAYNGQIQAKGPRYCPSIETKIERFADKERHQIFLEPEGRGTNEVYVNGFSSGFGREIQERMLRMVAGLESAEVMRYAYAIEYDYVPPEQLKLTLETKLVDNLYIAGQLNGTTGYEEAAALGLVAGANAALKVSGREPLILDRDSAYIGVMIDDLIMRGVDEPYRMFTSRAEYRLLLRHDNADRRLTLLAAKLGLVDGRRVERLRRKVDEIARASGILASTHDANGSMLKFLARPETTWEEIVERIPLLSDISSRSAEQVCIDVKYEGYIKRQEADVERVKRLSMLMISEDVDYSAMKHLRIEAREKLEKFRPINLSQASRISGITPADIAVLTVYTSGKEKKTRDEL
ncbi:MAG: tRNA uridine-5-carboxymethylaminomethyl(34) synthesis enzyme MnmG [Planctomycetaceae bacterium]|jgi:tRNA uridine 5-carboxymethylaminomethyl modification enzyme|nr:tRNA uridine-5-carboxymethylaminomethyl(34) synthesis enzyme MnmG [Planctomycetaceae bacterium]